MARTSHLGRGQLLLGGNGGDRLRPGRLAWLQTGKLQNTTESAHLLLGLAEVRVHAIVEGAHPGDEGRLGTRTQAREVKGSKPEMIGRSAERSSETTVKNSTN